MFLRGNDLEFLFLPFGRVGAQQHDVGVADHSRQRVVEIVSDPCGELAHGSERILFLGAEILFLFVCDVLKQ